MTTTRREEIFSHLQHLYEGCGYVPYKMRKFEEYDLYAHNKSFLLSEKILTFTDTDGKLMALKPDVTLSVVKTVGKELRGTKKVSYSESVYRPGGGSEGFKEIRQIGLECIGRIDTYLVTEVLSLAAESLSALSEQYVLDVSHMGFLSALFLALGVKAEDEEELLNYIGQKNLPAVRRFCEEKGISEEMRTALFTVTRLSAPLSEALELLAPYATSGEAREAYLELSALSEALRAWPSGSEPRLDFSVQNDRNYYNGIVFQGYVPSVPEAVLSGGRYDRLMERMGNSASAIGFALCPEMIPVERGDGFDVDALLLYRAVDSPAIVARALNALRQRGMTVRAEMEDSDCTDLRYRYLFRPSDVCEGGDAE